MQWPWSPPPDPPARAEPEPEELPPTVLERLQRLEAAFLSLQADWDETLDKISRHFARSSARQRQRLHRDMEVVGAETHEDAPGATNGENGHETSHQDRKAALRAAVNARRIGRA